MSRRLFNAAERAALFIAADGKCQICGVELDDTWEADHVHPYSEGGDTDILNGQALCQTCNRQKGDKILSDRIKLREFQQRLVELVQLKAKQGVKEVVLNVCPGSGKTLGSQAAVDRLIADGYVKQVVVLVPRLNLAAQYELDWREMCNKLPYPPAMGSLNHSNNTLPLVYKGASGYVTTYASLCANPQIHIRQIASMPTALICDEAHQLGAGEGGIDKTASAKWVEECAKHAKMVIAMSGTPFRTDGSPLLFASYSNAGDGKYVLNPDLEATYRDGVRDGYLRRFEAVLANGGYTFRYFDGSETEISLDDEETRLKEALRVPEIWQELIALFVDKLKEQKRTVDPRMCGLVAAIDQRHAKDIQQYFKRRYPELRVLIAISDDGEEAHKALRDFKRGKHDVLVTVSMAYVGYDYKYINTIALLTHFRALGYLQQLVARGLRMAYDISKDKQACYVVAPQDKNMLEFIEHMRRESNAGYNERERRIDPPNGPGPGPTQLPMGYATDGYIDELIAMGIDPNGDLNPTEYAYAEQLRRARGLPYPVTDLVAFSRAFGDFNAPQTRTAPRKHKTMQEQMDEARSKLNLEIGSLALQLNNGVFDSRDVGKAKAIIRGKLKRIYGKSVTEAASLDEILQQSTTVLRWKGQGYTDGER